ncbi:MAG: 2-C-methyl-D-erythritol 2,4-cyclodiphosphate synthase [Firmicutes bacterium]|nr:2-C-methyl-D-erythritol 2,4-cyclodiphosphate synthase [Bacillota bacterium]
MYEGIKVSAIIVAAGKGRRFGGDVPKQFLRIGKKTILETAFEKLRDNASVDELVVVTQEEYLDKVNTMLDPRGKGFIVVPGGEERQDSVMNGLRASTGGLVLVHDGARPFVGNDVIDRVIEGAFKDGAAVPVVNPKDSIRTKEGNLRRDELFMIQTPQGFRREIIIDAYDKAVKDGFTGTDEGGVAEHAGYEVTMVAGDYANLKITTREDLHGMEVRTGTGFDVHRLVEGRKCILMGVEIPYEKGLLGHSDADVALHALMDAMLGAAGLGDIGRLFPDTDPAYEGISSLKLLEIVRDRIADECFRIGNADVTIICQKPKVSPHIPEMTRTVAEVLGIEANRINIKGTTTEKLGFTGRGEGIASEAVCTLIR